MSKVTWFEIYKCLAVRMLSPRSYAVECGPCRRGYGSGQCRYVSIYRTDASAKS